ERAAAGLRAHEGLLGQDGGGRRAVMVGAHANFTLSDRTLEQCGSLAREGGVGLHIHVAEAVDDRENTGGDLVARMERLGALQPGSLLAHCVHLEADALRRIEDAGAWVSHQPRSNMNNAVGYAPLTEFGYRTILGTDGIGSDMITELQTGWFRAQEAGVSWSPARWLQVLVASARFAGERLGVRLGRIEPGAAADLLVLDPQPGPPLTEDNLAAAFLFRLSAQAVRHVVVDGHMVLRDRMPVPRDGGIRDVAALDRRAQRVSTQLWERMR
ncbi:MAG: amidohydrolase family protein, partial [Myxococcota bacterium]|nr:amidohydrolase family protein [Myxococcota bacterium]